MNCRNCAYPLWNLPARSCPECGVVFAPSEFTFRPGAVRYCCPQCDQVYYGTSPTGHLVPPSFDCVRCGRHLAMDEMVLRPGDGSAWGAAPWGQRPEQDEMPWLERRRHGVVRAWFKTAGRAMTVPAVLMDSIPESTPQQSAVGFALMNIGVYFAVGTLPWFVLSVAGAGGPGLLGVPFIDALAMSALDLVATVVGFFIWAWTTHGLLHLFGAASAPLRRTWHAIGYSSAAGALSAVPLGCLSTVGGIWWWIAACVMVGRAHRCSAWRAVLATILAGIVAALPAAAISLGPFGLGIWRMAATRGAVTMQTAAQANDPVAAALMAWHIDSGRWPDHAALLLADGLLVPEDLVLDGVIDDDDHVAGGIRLARFDGEEETGPLVAAAIASLPPDAIGHRAGDWIFLRGDDAGAPSEFSATWLAVAAPPGGGRESTRRVNTTVHVILDNGMVAHYPVESWEGLVRTQNTLRAQQGRPGLPLRYSDWCDADVLRPAR